MVTILYYIDNSTPTQIINCPYCSNTFQAQDVMIHVDACANIKDVYRTKLIDAINVVKNTADTTATNNIASANSYTYFQDIYNSLLSYN